MSTNNIPRLSHVKRNSNVPDNSIEKLDNFIVNYYEERNKLSSINSVSKNTEFIKRFKSRIEKGVKLIPIERDFKNFDCSKNNFNTIKPKSSILENWNKFEKKNMFASRESKNSDILRLELINLNLNTNNYIEQIRGSDKLNDKNRKKRSSSIDQI